MKKTLVLTAAVFLLFFTTGIFAFSAQSSDGSIDANFVLISTVSGEAGAGSIDFNYFLTQLPTGNYSADGIDANVGVYFPENQNNGNGNHDNQNNNTGGVNSSASGGVSEPPIPSFQNFFNGRPIEYSITLGGGAVETFVQRNATRSSATGGSYTFTISITTDSNVLDFTIQEVIPKQIVKDVNQITFSLQPTRIILSDPVVEWDYNSLPKEQRNEISYTIRGLGDSSIDGNNFGAFFETMKEPEIIAQNDAIIPDANSCANLNCDDNDLCTIDGCLNGTCYHKDYNFPFCSKSDDYSPETSNGQFNLAMTIIAGLIIIIVLIFAYWFGLKRRSGKNLTFNPLIKP